MTREVEARLKISAVDKTGRILQQVAGRMQQVNRQAAALNRQQGILGSTTASTMAVMSRYLAPAAVAAFTAGAVKDFAAVERQMTRIGITAGASAQEVNDAFGEMQRRAKEMALPLDSVTSAVDTLVASGLSLKEAIDFLPSVLATAQASGSVTEDIANTAIKAASALKIEASEMQRAFDIMVTQGKAGQFELKDMATYIPELANSFATLGYSGTDGLAQLGAVLQTLREDTGSAAAAATQAQNIFGKMFSSETEGKFKKFGVNIRKEMDAAVKSGEGAIDAYVRISNRVMKENPSAKLVDLFSDQEFRLGMQSLMSSTDSLKKFYEVANSGEVDGAVFRDLNKVLADTQSSLDRLSESWDQLTNRFGGKVAGVVTPIIDSVVSATDKQDAVNRALKGRGMGYLESQWHQVGLSQHELDMLAIEGGYKDSELRKKYEHGPRVPDGWEPEKEFPGGGTGAIPVPYSRPSKINTVPGRDKITAAMLSRKGEIEFANSSASVVGLRPEQRDADLQHLLANLDRVEKGGSGRPWLDDGEKVGTEVGAAAIERMSSDAGAIGTIISETVQATLKALAPGLGASIGQSFVAAAGQLKISVNTGGVGGKNVNADTGRTMPTNVGLPASTGG